MRRLPSPGVLQQIGRTHQLLCSAEIGVAWVENGGPHEDVPDQECCGEVDPKVAEVRFVIPEREEFENPLARLGPYLEDWVKKESQQIEDKVIQWLDDGLCPECDEKKDDITLRCASLTGKTFFSCLSCFKFPMVKWKRKLGKQVLGQPYPEEPNRGNGAW
jgi:hypothetical protein